MKKIIIFIAILFICVSCGKKEDLPKYESDLVCHLKINENIEEDEIESDSIIYIYKDGDLVTSAIYQSIIESSDFTSINMYNEIVNLYNDIDGINAKTIKIENKIILEINYDYKKIDIDEVRNKLGNLLDENSLFKQVNNLPIKLDEFKTIELNGYECE